MEAKTSMEVSAAREAEIDAKRPTLEQRGNKRMYHVGLTDDAPFDNITVPTVILRGTIRGKCVSVPKKTANVHMGPNNVLVHTEGQRAGAFETLYDIEVEGFIRYCDTHVFRKTSEYKVPEVGPDGKATGKKLDRWRAEIEPLDPGNAGGARALHDEQEVQRETISKYVWIVPANVNRSGKPESMGASPSIAEMRKGGEFKLDDVRKPKVDAPPNTKK